MVRRVALAADSTVADLAPGLAEHFVRAEVRRFDYGELDHAIVWAGGASEQRIPAPATRMPAATEAWRRSGLHFDRSARDPALHLPRWGSIVAIG